MIRFLLFLIVLGCIYFTPLKHITASYKEAQNRNKGHPRSFYEYKQNVAIRNLDLPKNELAPQVPQDARSLKTVRFIASNIRLAKRQDSLYGILPSITMAQAIIESRNGKSILATKNSNYFGIKCFSKTCSKGHCSNFSDDTHKDFFRIFKTKEESYTAHSLLLKKDLYKSLYLDRDYRNWAQKLKNCHYATDSLYDTKLIYCIEKYRLWQFDN